MKIINDKQLLSVQMQASEMAKSFRYEAGKLKEHPRWKEYEEMLEAIMKYKYN